MIRTKTVIDPARLARVAQALRDGDYSACIAEDWQQGDDLLCAIGLLENNVPDLARRVFEFLSRESLQYWMEQKAEQAADHDGFGDAWRAAIAAGRSPGRKDYRLRMSELLQKAYGINQQDACRMMAEQSGKDADPDDIDVGGNIRRVVTRAKRRSNGD